MKELSLFIVSFFLFLISISSVLAQKEMKLAESLDKNSTPMQAKPKGIGTVTKYQFGPYKIVSGKEGWTTTTANSRFFSLHTESKSKKKLSFVFVKDLKDSVLVNVSVNTDIKQMDSHFAEGWSILKDSKENYMAIMSFPSDTATWRMMIANRVGSDVKGEPFEGMLTDGNSSIQIKEVEEWNDGKKSKIIGTVGYEFYSGGSSVAAVQASPDTFQKKIVWIRSDVDTKLQLILAAASAAMMVRVESTLTD